MQRPCTSCRSTCTLSLFDRTLLKGYADPGNKAKTTVFDVLGEVHDEIQGKPRQAPGLPAALALHPATLLGLASKSEHGADKQGEEESSDAKIEDLVLLVVSIYGVGGWTSRGAKEFRADVGRPVGLRTRRYDSVRFANASLGAH
jgi:hypothetical protein